MLNERDGKLVSKTQIYDIETDTFIALSHEVHTAVELRSLPRGVSAYAAFGSTSIVLVNAAHESVVLPGNLLSFVTNGPGLEGPHISGAERSWIL